MSTKGLWLQQCGSGVAKNESDSRVEARGNVVENEILEGLFVQILGVLWPPLEGQIGRHEHSVVGGGAVKKLDQILVRVDYLSSMLGVV